MVFYAVVILADVGQVFLMNTSQNKIMLGDKPKIFVVPREYWSYAAREKAFEVANIAEEAGGRVYIPGILFGKENEQKQLILKWREKLNELISEVKKGAG